MDVSGGNSARGTCFLAQVLKPLHKSRRKMPNTRNESPEMDRGSRGEAFRDGIALSNTAMAQTVCCCHGRVGPGCHFPSPMPATSFLPEYPPSHRTDVKSAAASPCACNPTRPEPPPRGQGFCIPPEKAEGISSPEAGHQCH